MPRIISIILNLHIYGLTAHFYQRLNSRFGFGSGHRSIVVNASITQLDCSIGRNINSIFLTLTCGKGSANIGASIHNGEGRNIGILAASGICGSNGNFITGSNGYAFADGIAVDSHSNIGSNCAGNNGAVIGFCFGVSNGQSTGGCGLSDSRTVPSANIIDNNVLSQTRVILELCTIGVSFTVIAYRTVGSAGNDKAYIVIIFCSKLTFIRSIILSLGLPNVE